MHGVKSIYHSIWDCSQKGFKKTRAMFFSQLGGTGNNFRSGLKFSREGCSRLDLTPPIAHRGDLMSALKMTLRMIYK